MAANLTAAENNINWHASPSKSLNALSPKGVPTTSNSHQNKNKNKNRSPRSLLGSVEGASSPTDGGENPYNVNMSSNVITPPVPHMDEDGYGTERNLCLGGKEGFF